MKKWDKSSWDFIELEKLASISSGGTPSRSKKEYYNGEIPWAKISDIESAKNKVIKDTIEKISEDGLNSIRNKIFEKGTLFFAMYGSVGKTAFAGVKMSTNQAILGINSFGNLDLNFLNYWFVKNKLRLLNSARGVALKNLSAGIIRKTKIPLPPLPIQKEIAELLDTADALRQKTQSQLDALDELAQSVFLEMFGEVGTKECKWDEAKIGDITFDIIGGSSYGGEDKQLEEDELGVLKISAVTTGTFKPIFKAVKKTEINKKLVYPLKGDLLFSRANTRELVGAICIVDNNYSNLFIPDKLWRIDIKKDIVNNYFFKYVLQNRNYKTRITKKATGTSGSMLNISKKKLREILFPLPPLELQTQFATIIENIEAQKALLKQSLQESEDLFNGLLQEVFS